MKNAQQFRVAIQLVFMLLPLLLVGCTQLNQQKEDKLRSQLLGDWVVILEPTKEVDSLLPPPPPPPLPPMPQNGMTFSKDSIEFYLEFVKFSYDTIRYNTTVEAFGRTVPYKLDDEAIVYLNPITKQWTSLGKFVHLQHDTLTVALEESKLVRYKKLQYDMDALPEFDQIVFSRTGCYGSCPILDISIDKQGKIFYQGEGYIQPLGFYSAQLNPNLTATLFNTFRKANPLALPNEFYENTSDLQSFVTTFIQKGQIVKTIDDYGGLAPNELLWAYDRMGSLPSSIAWNKLPKDEPLYPKLHYYTFRKGNKELPLQKSESFYLWTQLQQSKQVNVSFKENYTLFFLGNYTYWGPDPDEASQHQYEIKSIVTDGRFYRFEYSNRASVTHDLGYNFIDRNFKPDDFVEALN